MAEVALNVAVLEVADDVVDVLEAAVVACVLTAGVVGVDEPPQPDRASASPAATSAADPRAALIRRPSRARASRLLGPTSRSPHAEQEPPWW